MVIARDMQILALIWRWPQLPLLYQSACLSPSTVCPSIVSANSFQCRQFNALPTFDSQYLMPQIPTRTNQRAESTSDLRRTILENAHRDAPLFRSSSDLKGTYMCQCQRSHTLNYCVDDDIQDLNIERTASRQSVSSVRFIPCISSNREQLVICSCSAIVLRRRLWLR